jgi:hypothetical protein
MFYKIWFSANWIFYKKQRVGVLLGLRDKTT